MCEKDLLEKFVEEEISEAETLDLFQELNSNSEMTDELQHNLYMNELMEQSFKEERSANVFIENLTERIQEENKSIKMRTGKFNKLNSGTYKKPVSKKKKKKSPAPILIFSAIAACLAIGLTVLAVKNQNSSVSSGTSTADASTSRTTPTELSSISPEVSSNLYIQDVKGLVTVKRKGQTFKLKNGDFILKGDVLATGQKGAGSLYFISEKTKIILRPKSEFSIESKIDKTEQNKIFHVLKGRAYFDVAHQQDGANFSIKSTMADSRIIGTRLEVSSLSDSTTVKVFEGLVRVKSKLSGDIVDVPGNHYVSILDSSYPIIRSINGKVPKVIGFSLVDARSDKLAKGFEILKDGIILKRSQIPEFLSIRINTSNSEYIDGVRTLLKDSKGELIEFKGSTKYEKFLPYTMTGDKIPGDYNEWEATPGEYILEVEVYNLTHFRADSETLTFTIR